MGIKNLLPTLKPIERQRHVKDYSGQTVGVDALCWMHQAAYKCAKEKNLNQKFQNRFSSTQNLISYCMQKVRMLQVNGVKCILVFDGAQLPMKSRVEKDRKKMRKECQEKAVQLWNQGNLTQANKKFMESIEIDDSMVHDFIQELKHTRIQYIVSPYESDAQLAFLYKQGRIDVVITEDSDLLAYGARKVLFKMDPSGNGIEINLNELNLCPDYKMSGSQEFTQSMLLSACIISGCDYHSGISGIGYKTAVQYIKTLRPQGDIKSLCQDLQRMGKINDWNAYYNEYCKVEMTFKHQIVYDPLMRQERYLEDVASTNDLDLSFLGKIKRDEIAIQAAEGDVNPNTLERYSYQFERYNLSSEQKKITKIMNSLNGFSQTQAEQPILEKNETKNIEEFINNSQSTKLVPQQKLRQIVPNRGFRMCSKKNLSQTSSCSNIPTLKNYRNLIDQNSQSQGLKQFFQKKESPYQLTKRQQQMLNVNLKDQIQMNNDLVKKRNILRSNFILKSSSKLKNIAVKQIQISEKTSEKKDLTPPAISPIKISRTHSPILPPSQKFVSRIQNLGSVSQKSVMSFQNSTQGRHLNRQSLSPRIECISPVSFVKSSTEKYSQIHQKLVGKKRAYNEIESIES